MYVTETATCCFIINKYHSRSLSNLLSNHAIFRGGSRRVVESLDLWIHLEFQTSTSSEGREQGPENMGVFHLDPFKRCCYTSRILTLREIAAV